MYRIVAKYSLAHSLYGQSTLFGWRRQYLIFVRKLSD